MIIIIEGTNKAGKSTLVKKIQETFPNKQFEIIKVSQPRIENNTNFAYIDYMAILDIAILNKDKNYIIDRFHFGPFVYGPIYRGKPDFGYESFYQIEEKIMKLDYVFILCISSKSFMKKKFIEENEEFADINKIDEEITLFNNISKRSRLRIFNHNLPKNDNTNKIINAIKQYDI